MEVFEALATLSAMLPSGVTSRELLREDMEDLFNICLIKQVFCPPLLFLLKNGTPDISLSLVWLLILLVPGVGYNSPPPSRIFSINPKIFNQLELNLFTFSFAVFRNFHESLVGSQRKIWILQPFCFVEELIRSEMEFEWPCWWCHIPTIFNVLWLIFSTCYIYPIFCILRRTSMFFQFVQRHRGITAPCHL